VLWFVLSSECQLGRGTNEREMEKRLTEMLEAHNELIKSCGITADYIRSLKFKVRHKTKRYYKIGRELKNHPLVTMINSEKSRNEMASNILRAMLYG
jgi:hypothetical protein